DPRTGVGLTDHSLVTVIAADGMTADGLATAVSVLGPTAGLKLVAKVKGASAHIVRKPGDEIESVESPGFRRFYSIMKRFGPSSSLAPLALLISSPTQVKPATASADPIPGSGTTDD